MKETTVYKIHELLAQYAEGKKPDLEMCRDAHRCLIAMGQVINSLKEYRKKSTDGTASIPIEPILYIQYEKSPLDAHQEKMRDEAAEERTRMAEAAVVARGDSVTNPEENITVKEVSKRKGRSRKPKAPDLFQ